MFSEKELLGIRRQNHQSVPGDATPITDAIRFGRNTTTNENQKEITADNFANFN